MNYRNKQQGVVLVIALIALVAISLAGVALMRTVDTGNVVAGNIAFNEAANQMADVGAESAYVVIDSNRVAANPGSNCQAVPPCPAYYYPNYAPLDPVSKLPTSPSTTWSPLTEVLLPGETAGNGSYHVQYLIERMCQGTGVSGAYSTTVSDPLNRATFAACNAVPAYSQTTGLPISGIGKLYFRITVQVTGPKNTRSLAQYFYGVQDDVY